MPRCLVRLISPLCLVVALTACGGGGSDDAQSDPPQATGTSTATDPEDTETPAAQPEGAAVDPCSLLDAAELEAALGEPVGDSESGTQELGVVTLLNCTWPSQAGTRVVTLSVTEESSLTASLGIEEFHEQSKALVSAQEIDGVGLDAYLDPLTGLYVLTEDAVVSVMVVGSGGEEVADEVLVDLAGRAIARL